MKITWYEESADAPDYVYFHHLPDMLGENYRFAGMHIHKSVEILVVYKGVMRCTVNEETREIPAGSIFIANSYDTHYYEYVGNASAYILVIGVEYLTEILTDKTEFENFIFPLDSVFLKLIKHLKTASVEIKEYNLLMKRAFVYTLMGILHDSGLIRKRDKNANKEFFIKVSEYIFEHYAEDLSLSSLAAIFGYSANYFSSVFNKTSGVTINEYINRVRVLKVIEKIKHGDNRINKRQIVFSCGFKSMETFYRALRKNKSIYVM